MHVEYLAASWPVSSTSPSIAGAASTRGRGPAVRAYRPWEELPARRHAAALGRCRSTSRWPPASRASRSSTATPGTRTSRAIWPSCSTTSRTSQPSTASSRCGRGRPSNSAGGYAVSSYCERTALEAADAIIAVSREQARDILACYPAVEPERMSVIHNGIDAERVPARSGHATCWIATASTRRARRSSSSAASRARRASPTCSTQRCRSIQRAQFVLCAGSPDTPELARRDRGEGRALRTRRGGIIWIDQMLGQAEVDPDPQPRDGLRCARRSTSRSASSTSRRWPARRPWWRREPAASPRSSRTA